MGTVYLVRHGQASFGAADYDQLSPLGAQQCQALGQWFAGHGLQFEAVLTGTLRRHTQSLQALATGYASGPAPLLRLPAAQAWPGLNEYDPEAVVSAVLQGGIEHAAPGHPQDSEGRKAYFRLLRRGLLAWMQGQTQPRGMPCWADFAAGVRAALAHVHAQHTGHVLVISSGGPIATAVAQLLGSGPEATVELNLRLRNSAVTELARSTRGHQLLSFNHLPHLDAPARRGWVTYA